MPCEFAASANFLCRICFGRISIQINFCQTGGLQTTGSIITRECTNYGCSTREAWDRYNFIISGIAYVDLETNLGYSRLLLMTMEERQFFMIFWFTT